jgi:hypothetical protein
MGSTDETLIKIGASVENATAAIDKLNEKLKSIGTAAESVAVKAGVAFTAIQAFKALALTKFAEDELAADKLTAAMKNQGIYTDELRQKYEELSKTLSRKTGFDDAEIANSQAMMQGYMGQIEVTGELLQATMDFARFKRIDLVTAAEMVGKTIGGETNALKRSQIQVDETADEHTKFMQVLAGLNKVSYGMAETYGNTLTGAMSKMNAEMDRSLSLIGQQLQPAMIKMTKTVTDFLAKLNDSPEALAAFAKGISIAAIALGAATAIATLTAGIVSLMKYLQIAMAAFQAMTLFFVANPIGLAIAGITIAIAALGVAWYTNFGQIQERTAGVIEVLKYLFGGFGEFIKKIFQDVIDAITITVGWVEKIGSAVGGWMSKIGSNIGGTANAAGWNMPGNEMPGGQSQGSGLSDAYNKGYNEKVMAELLATDAMQAQLMKKGEQDFGDSEKRKTYLFNAEAKKRWDKYNEDLIKSLQEGEANYAKDAAEISKIYSEMAKEQLKARLDEIDKKDIAEAESAKKVEDAVRRQMDLVDQMGAMEIAAIQASEDREIVKLAKIAKVQSEIYDKKKSLQDKGTDTASERQTYAEYGAILGAAFAGVVVKSDWFSKEIEAPIILFAQAIGKSMGSAVDKTVKLIEITGMIVNAATKVASVINEAGLQFKSMLSGEWIQTFSDFTAELGNMPSALMSSLSDFSKNLDDLPAKIKGTMEYLPRVFDSVLQKFQEVFPTLVTSILNAIPKIIEKFTAAAPAIVKILFQAADALIRKIPEMFKNLIALSSEILKSVLEELPLMIREFFQIIPELIKELATAIPGLVLILVENMPAIAIALIEGMAKAAPSLIMAWVAVSAAWELIGLAISAAMAAASGLWILIGGLIGAAIPPGILASIGVVLAAVVAAIPMLALAVGAAIIAVLWNNWDEVCKFFQEIFESVWAGLKETIAIIFEPIFNPLISAFNTLFGWIQDLIDALSFSADKSGAGGTLGKIFGGDIIGGISDTLGGIIDVPNWFGSTGGRVQYASVGKFMPAGSDTIPAMLSPGEHVINARAAQANRGLLNKINNGQSAEGGDEIVLRIVGDDEFGKMIEKSLVRSSSMGTGRIRLAVGSET